MRALTKSLLLLIALGAGPGVVAQEQPPATPDATTTEVAEVVTPATKTEKEDQAKAEKAPAPLDNYRPSENISQDLGVSFPVDI